jgi:peptidyl-prolyl cis-trans isomerase C
VLARVGGKDVTADAVARIARAQGVDAAHALDIAVRDTLLAAGAEARGLAGTSDVKLAREGDLARRTLRRVLAEARATPPTEAELRDAAERKWLDVDRPEGFRTVHAAVRFASGDDDAKRARARALAEAIRAAARPVVERAGELPLAQGVPAQSLRMPVLPKEDPDPLSAAFRQMVPAVASRDPGLQVVIEPLPPVAASGRLLVSGDERLDEAFARAAAALPERGALSPVVESSHGAHVILLLERTPAVVLQGPARLARLRDDIVNERARAAQKQLLAGLKAQSSIEPDAVALLGLVAVYP